MSFFVVALAHAFASPALVAGLLPALAGDGRSFTANRVALSVGAGFVLGVLALAAALANAAFVSTETATRGIALAVILLFALALLSRVWLRLAADRAMAFLGPLLLAILTAKGVFDFYELVADHKVTVTGVVNTELVVNAAAILFGFVLMVAFAALTARVAAFAGPGFAAAALLVVLALNATLASGALMLGLLRLEIVTVTPGRISFVAKVAQAGTLKIYAELAIALLLAIVGFVRRRRVTASADRVDRRRQLARILADRRWRVSLTGVCAFLFVLLLYQDLYASRPPTLSPAAPVEADANGEIGVAIDSVKDGALHRFAYVSSSGHRVRFFLINKYDEAHAQIGVVFDACTICGDGGYLQRGDEVICAPCSVRIFRPSIGKSGGCNPIPLPHETRDGRIVIAAAALEKGARYFGEIVEVRTADPVTGEALVNLKAPFQYEYRGKTFFFGSRESYERFRANPDRFIHSGASGAPPAPAARG